MTRTRAAWFGNVGMILVMVIGSVFAGGAGGVLFGASYQISLVMALRDQGGRFSHEGLCPVKIGAMVGAASAVLVSAVYCWRIILAHRRLKGWRLIGRGVLLGVAAGGVSALMVHAGVIAGVQMDPSLPRLTFVNPILLTALTSGVLVGALMGAIGGRLADVPRPDEPTPASAPA